MEAAGVPYDSKIVPDVGSVSKRSINITNLSHCKGGVKSEGPEPII